MGVLEIIEGGLAAFGLPAGGEKLVAYLERMLDYNRVVNLTAIRDPEEAALRHVVDSLSLFSLGVIRPGDRILDIGTGAGFPAAPLAILSDCEVTALDSVQKKVRFVAEAGEALGLHNLHALAGRAEELAHTGLRESFDLVTARGVTKLRALAEYALPFAKVGGHLLAMKGEDVAEEIEEASHALAALGGELIRVERIPLPGSEIVHTVAVIRKRSRTSTKYPRKQAAILKSPL